MDLTFEPYDLDASWVFIGGSVIIRSSHVTTSLSPP
jgi:hypothetical protein